MKKYFLQSIVTALFCFQIFISFAQPTIEWQKCLGGSDQEVAYSIQQTNDNGYIIAGTTPSMNGDVTGNHGNFDNWVVKLDSLHNIQWEKCFGGSSAEGAHSIQQTKDGGYIMAGNTFSNDGDISGWHIGYDQGYPTSDCWIVKIDNSGSIQWQKCLGGSNYDWAYSIQQTSDSGYIVAGYTESNDGAVTGNHPFWGYDYNCDCYTLINSPDFWVVKLTNT